MRKFIHLFCLCSLGLAIKLNFNSSKVAFWNTLWLGCLYEGNCLQSLFEIPIHVTRNYCYFNRKVRIQFLTAIFSNYRESAESCKNLNLFLFHQKIPLGKLFSKIIFKSSSETLVWRKIEKFETWETWPKGGWKLCKLGHFENARTKQRKLVFTSSLQDLLHIS